jgi:hypothetical protein
MTEEDMADILESQLDALEKAGIDMYSEQRCFYVGEWLIAFEGVYVANQRHPGVLDEADVKTLVDYFGVDMSELDQ